jgi:NADH-quinone oxidoreductase subunit L
MRRFGGLGKFMKITWITFGMGWLAILGIPPFAGFWSKDKIIETAFAAPGARGWILGLATLIGAGITAFYMSRLFFMTFQGKQRWSDTGKDAQHPHESPLTMTVPMIVLAGGSGLLGLVLAWLGFSTWLHPVFGGEEHAEHTNWPLMGITLLVVAAGVALAWMRYWRDDVPVRAPKGNLLTQAARADLYQDAINEDLFMRPGQRLTQALLFTDNHGVDGTVGAVAGGVGGLSDRLRRIQNGYARSYALTMLAGVVAVLGALWVMN